MKTILIISVVSYLLVNIAYKIYGIKHDKDIWGTKS